MDEDLRRLVDEQAIYRRLVDYCRGVDRGDAALVASVYHADGTDDHGSFQGLGVDFAEYVTRRLDRYEATMHTIANPVIMFTGPDLALVECHVCARQRRTEDGGVVLETFGGRYVDRFERRDSEWRIAHRTCVHEWDKLERPELAFPPGRFTEGVRGPSDVSYPAPG
jgi:SnoaL-like domain